MGAVLCTYRSPINSIVTAVDGVIPSAVLGLVLAVAHSEHTYILIPFVFLLLVG